MGEMGPHTVTSVWGSEVQGGPRQEALRTAASPPPQEGQDLASRFCAPKVSVGAQASTTWVPGCFGQNGERERWEAGPPPGIFWERSRLWEPHVGCLLLGVDTRVNLRTACNWAI